MIPTFFYLRTKGILVRNKAMSIETLATRHGLDAEKERQRIGAS